MSPPTRSLSYAFCHASDAHALESFSLPPSKISVSKRKLDQFLDSCSSEVLVECFQILEEMEYLDKTLLNAGTESFIKACESAPGPIYWGFSPPDQYDLFVRLLCCEKKETYTLRLTSWEGYKFGASYIFNGPRYRMRAFPQNFPLQLRKLLKGDHILLPVDVAPSRFGASDVLIAFVLDSEHSPLREKPIGINKDRFI